MAANFKELLVQRLRTARDATAYITQAELLALPSQDPPDKSIPDALWKDNLGPDKNGSFDFGLEIKKDKSARVQASRCYCGGAWSFTVRRNDVNEDDAASDLGTWVNGLNSIDVPYRPSPYHVYDKPTNISLASFAEIGEDLLRLVQDAAGEKLKGLILITGETSCGKSNISRGLIWSYLMALKCKKEDRNLHLVTYEDPIEEWFWHPRELSKPALKKGKRRIDYTPREKGKDVGSLTEATDAALRQTPSLFFAGELRDPKDLAAAVSFGGTGHLIVATSHAGSLIEATAKVFNAVGASSAGDRAAHAPKLLAIVHLKRMKVSFQVHGKSLTANMVVPSVYRRRGQGLQSLVADGLASVLPYCPEVDRHERYGSLGRQHMARRILKDPKALAIRKQAQSDWDKSAEKGTWEKHWDAIREFHAGIGSKDIVKGDSALWIECAKDDVYGLG